MRSLRTELTLKVALWSAATWSFGCAISLLLLIAVSQFAFAQSLGTSAPAPNVAKPDNYIELLRNVKTAIDDKLLLNPDFFSDHSLLSFFGDGVIIRHNMPIGRISGEITGYSDRFDSSRKPTILSRAAVDFWAERSSARVEAGVEVRFLTLEAGRPSFDEVVAIFGKEWVLFWDPSPRMHGQLERPTAPHGNEIIIYQSVRASLKSEIRITFSFDGLATRASAWLAEMKQ